MTALVAALKVGHISLGGAKMAASLPIEVHLKAGPMHYLIEIYE